MDEMQLLFEQCLTHARYIRNLSPKYIAGVRLSCRLFFRHSGADRLSQCTRDAVEAWLLDGRAGKGWRPATFRTHHRNL